MKLNKHTYKNGLHTPDWVIIDGVDYQNDATADFAQLICDAYDGPKPKGCSA